MNKAIINDQTEPSWDIYSLGLVSIFLIFGIFQWSFLPRFIDIYYHLEVMLGFNRAGGFITREFLEYAPLGRAHIYPPLLHILMLLLYKLGLSKIFIARFFEYIIYPGILITIWQVAKKIFGSRIAFFTIFIWVSVYSLYLVSYNLIPFSLAMIFWLFAFLCLEKNKPVTAALLLGLAFYTHTFMSLLGLGTIFLYGIFNASKRTPIVKVCLLAIAVAFPILVYQYQNRSYFKFPPPQIHAFMEINILVYLLALIGIVIAIKNRGAYYFIITSIIVMLALNFTHQSRYLSGHGMVGFIFAASLAVDYIYQKIVAKRLSGGRFLVFLISLILCLFVLNPTVYIDSLNKIIDARLFNSTIINLLPKYKRYFYTNEVLLYHSRFMNQIVEIIKRNTDRDDIIYSNLNYPGGLLSVLSDRAYSKAMLPEVRSYADFDPVKSARLVIWFKELNNAFSRELASLVEKYNLRKIAETDLAYIYSNPYGYEKIKVPKSVIPAPLLFSILFAVIGLLIWSLNA